MQVPQVLHHKRACPFPAGARAVKFFQILVRVKIPLVKLCLREDRWRFHPAESQLRSSLLPCPCCTFSLYLPSAGFAPAPAGHVRQQDLGSPSSFLLSLACSIITHFCSPSPAVLSSTEGTRW